MSRPSAPVMALVSLGLVLALPLVSCRAPDGDTSSESSTPREAQTPSPEVDPELPKITSVKQAGGEALRVPASADWVLVAFGRAWVSAVGRGVGFYNAKTGRLQGSVAVPQSPCASMDSGFGALWTATCGKRGIARIEPKTGEVTHWAAVKVSIEGESSIGAGEGGIWAIADANDCSGCVLVRIDPRTVKIASTYDIPEGGTAVRAGLGGVWITYSGKDRVAHVDPDTGTIVSEIDVGSGPRFLAVGEGGVWVMNQLDGSVSHLDPVTDRVVATIPVDPEAIFGGDITVGAGYVWLRGSSEMVAQIDRPPIVSLRGSAPLRPAVARMRAEASFGSWTISRSRTGGGASSTGSHRRTGSYVADVIRLNGVLAEGHVCRALAVDMRRREDGRVLKGKGPRNPGAISSYP